ncbi:hypothetical protein ACWEFL_35895 [Streptomyces sp. NPDC004838]
MLPRDGEVSPPHPVHRQRHACWRRPDRIAATNLITHGIDPAQSDAVVTPHATDAHGIDLITRTPDGRATAFQIKSHRQRPGPPPALPGAHAPDPSLPATVA